MKSLQSHILLVLILMMTSCTFKPSTALYGTLQVNTLEVTGQVYLDSIHIGTTPITIDSIPIGVHKLSITAVDRLTFNKEIIIHGNKPQVESITLRQIQPSPGMDVSWINDPVTLKRLGRYFVPRFHFKDAIACFEPLATQGDAEAQRYLAHFYSQGQGYEKDHIKAFEYYKLAADQGNMEAQRELYFIYLAGRGTSKNVKQAIKYGKLAAAQRHPFLYHLLGEHYQNGDGIAQDLTEAIRLYTLGSAAGDDQSTWALGKMYGLGQGVSKNRVLAKKYYELAQKQFNVYAPLIADFYRHGEGGLEKDIHQAIKYYLIDTQSDRGWAPSSYNKLGEIYEHGEGIPKDMQKAIKYYRQSAIMYDDDALKTVKRLGIERGDGEKWYWEKK